MLFFVRGGIKPLLSSCILYSFLKKEWLYILYPALQLSECPLGVYFLLNGCKIFTLQGKQAEKKCSISMLTELSALSFLISVLIINTNKTYGHITLFILIWSFKTKLLR